MHNPKLKIGLLLTGALLLASSILALCACLGSDSIGTPGVVTIAAILLVSFLIGVTAGFSIQPDRELPAAPESTSDFDCAPRQSFVRLQQPTVSTCIHRATKRDTAIGGLVAPARVAGRHGMAIFPGRFSVSRQTQLR